MSSRWAHKCVVCNRRRIPNSGLLLSRFPIDPERCKLWVQAIGQEDLVYLPIEKLHELKFVCEHHFAPGDFNENRNRLHRNAVPSLLLPLPPLPEELFEDFPLHVGYGKQQLETEPLEHSTSITKTKHITPWDHFDICDTENKQARCRICSENFSYKSSTGNLSAHLRRKHASLLEVQKVVQPAEEITVSASPEDPVDSDKNIPVPIEAIPSTSKAGDYIIVRSYKRMKKCSEPKGETSKENISSGTCSQGQIVPSLQCPKTKLEETELTPRKKKLVRQLQNTKCTLASLRKSAALVEKIDSPVLKELVISACRNQNRKSTGRRWTTKNKVSCLAILKRSPKTYRYLRHIIPLPSVKTLQNVLKKIPMEPGLNRSVLDHLSVTGQEKGKKEKTCVLLFDEMALKPRLIYNAANDQVEGFQDLGTSQEEGRSNQIADHVLVFMVQGIYKKFKQPIAFYFVKGTISSEKLAALIKEIITAVSATGHRILATVCDQGPTNVGAIKLLKQFSAHTDRSNTESSFYINDQEVFILYDIPHLFKSIRNNFLKNGTMIYDGKTAKWSHLIKVEEKNRNFLYLSKITATHIAPKYRAKMRVKFAAQVLSNTVSAVLKLLSEAEKNEELAAELMSTALVIQDLDRLFDFTNGPSNAEDIKKGQRQNVSSKTKHLDEWAKFENKLKTMQFINNAGTSATNVKCVHGYINSLKSLRGIWTEVKKIVFKFLNLRQLNQDSLENLFGVIRQHSPTNDNPTCAHFMTALKTAVVTGLTAPHHRGSNCTKDDNTLLTNFHDLVFGENISNNENEFVTQDPPRVMDIADDDDDIPVLSIPDVPDEDFELENRLSEVSEQPVVYISGYLAYKIFKTHKCESCRLLLTVTENLEDPMYNYIGLREWWKDKTSLTYPSQSLCGLVQNATAEMESEICTVLYKHNICQLAVTVFSAKCDIAWFNCVYHKTPIIDQIFILLARMLVRRQCQRLNQGIAAREEELADTVKKAQQQGVAK